MAIFRHRMGRAKKQHCGAFLVCFATLANNGLIRCLDIWEVGRGVAYALGHANMPGEVTRRAALRGDGLSKMSKLA